MSGIPTDDLLKEACIITRANWAVCMDHEADGWRIVSGYKLSKKKQNILSRYLNDPKLKAWVGGTLSSGRSRSRAIGDNTDLGCKRLYVFPVSEERMALIVGVRSLDVREQKIWKLAASFTTLDKMKTDTSVGESIGLIGLGEKVTFELPVALNQILDDIVGKVSLDGAWIAIRSGEILEIQAAHRATSLVGKKISLDVFRSNEQSQNNHLPIAVARQSNNWDKVEIGEPKDEFAIWAAVPLVVGQRQIGVIAVWRKTVFLDSEWDLLQNLADKVAPLVEIVLTFSGMADHLRRLALLNEFALTVASALDLDQIVQRVFAILGRTFRTDQINLFLLTSDSRTIMDYRNNNGEVEQRQYSVGNHPLANAISSGNILRFEAENEARTYSRKSSTQSILFVPLRYRGTVIGAVLLESSSPGAFTVLDEHLLVVIASHLAGLVEYRRLRDEAEARARNISLIHDVVQQVVGLTDIHEVSQIASDLVARNFSYELAIIMLGDESQKLKIAGIGGSAAGVVRRGLKKLEPDGSGGITRQVYKTGKSILANDVTKEPSFVKIPGWNAGSEMCVALWDGEEILGILDVESIHKDAFTANDMLVLESLGRILTTVIINANRYQQIQNTVQQLETTQEELRERIIAQQAAESRLVQAAKLAAVGEMAAGVAHEMNNPLTSIVGFTELVLEEQKGDTQQKKDLELVLREALRARGVVRRLLDFARQTESVRVNSDINQIIGDVVALVKHLLHTSGVHLYLDQRFDLPWLMVDGNQIKQVILNLIYNALHAMPVGGDLTISTRSRRRSGKEWITIEIKDTGIGISPENIERIFEPFFTTRASEGGTGLGLAVTYGIVTDHGGTIDVSSSPGDGTKFVVWLPLENK